MWDDNTGTKKEAQPVSTSNIKFKSITESKEDRGLKIISYGNFSTGKTHFALSAPGPVFILDTENGASPLADKFPDAKILKLGENGSKDNTEEKDEVKNFEKYQQAIEYLSSLPKEEVGTVIVDSMSDIWDWAQAYVKVKVFKIPVEQRLKQMWDWGTINKAYLKQLLKLINMDANVVITARAGEEYSGPGQPTGTFKPQCQKKTPYYVDMVLFHQIHFIKGEPTFSAKIEKCRGKGEIIGKIIDNPDFNKIKELL